MMTDETVRASLHARLDAGLDDLRPPADLLSKLRRRQARRSTLVVGAVAAATVSTAVLAPIAARAVAGGTSATPSAATSVGTSADGVNVGGYTFELPTGLKVAEGPMTQDFSPAMPERPYLGATTYLVATPSGRLGAAPAPAGEQPQRTCMAMRPTGWRGPATTKDSLLSCGFSLTIFVAQGRAALEANQTGSPTFGDLEDQRVRPKAEQRRPVDVGRGTAWVATSSQDRFVYLRVQLAPEESIEVFAIDVTEDQVVAMVRTAVRR